MSQSENIVLEVSWDDVKRMKEQKQDFVLFFFGKPGDSRLRAISTNVNCYAAMHTKIKWCFINFEKFISDNFYKDGQLRYRFIQFKDGEEVKCVNPENCIELHNFVTGLQNELDKNKDSSQQAHQLEESEKKEPESHKSDKISRTHKEKSLKRKRTDRPVVRRHTVSHTVTSESALSVLPKKSSGVGLAKYQVTATGSLKLISYASRPSESAPYPPITKPTPKQKSAQQRGTKSSKSTAKSKPIIPKSPIPLQQSAKIERKKSKSPSSSSGLILSGIKSRSSSTYIPGTPSTESQSEVSAPSQSLFKTTVSTNISPRQAHSSTISQIQPQYRSVESQSSSSSHSSSIQPLLIRQYPINPYPRLIKGLTTGISTQHSTQHQLHPNIQYIPRGVILHHPQPRPTPPRQPSSNRGSTPSRS